MTVLARARQGEQYYVLIEDEGRFYEARGVGDTETRAVNDAARVWQRDFPHARAVRVTVTIGPRP